MLLCVILAAAVPLAGCTAEPKPVAKTEQIPVQNPAMRLVAFESCDRLTADLRAATRDSVGPYGLPGSDTPLDDVIVGGARTTVDTDAGRAAKAAPPPAFSGTNTHEADADEPDLVKTDGRRIVTVEKGVLRVVDAASRRQTGKLDLGVASDQLLLAGDRALVLSPGQYGGYRGDLVARPMAIAGPQVLLVDLTGTPRVISRFKGEGTLVDARQTGSAARVVLRSSPRITFPRPIGNVGEEKLTDANRKAVDKAPASAWLPAWEVTTGGTTERGRVDCDQVSRPTDFSGASLVTVYTFDLGASALSGGSPVSVVADGDTVYGTATSLYIANDQRWRFRTLANQHTDIYRFAVSGTGPPTYQAAGRVPGLLVNQYALSEWDDHLRVASTEEGDRGSAVRVLAQQGDRLTQTGMVGGLGKGERIYSVRFIGPRGYVVTFRQTDPLYSLDLGNPAAPKVTGELKITGYSAHLQPVGDDRLIGIGQEADADGRVQGTQISLFDVSDPAKPTRLAQRHVPGGQSQAEFDPHALLWWPATKLLVVPMANVGREGTGQAASALALRVSADGLADVGEIKQSAVMRSLVVGDVLWTVSYAGLQASSLSTMERLSWLPNEG
jgi:uncharacterized secreted protein with C-terminal beta-propeller domain